MLTPAGNYRIFAYAKSLDFRCGMDRIAQVCKSELAMNPYGGAVFLFFNRSRRGALGKADAVVVIGTPMDFRLGYGKRFNADAKIIQIDTDPIELGRNREVRVPIESDARAFLTSITAELEGAKYNHQPWLDELRDAEDKSRAQMEEWMTSDREPIHPLRLCAEIANFVDENTIVVGDGGDIVSNASKVLPVNLPGQWYDPGPFGTLGVGTGFCMAIHSVYPQKRIIMVNGDGAFGLNGFDFDTFVRFNIPVVSVVGNDRQWGQIAVGQKAPASKTPTPTGSIPIVPADGPAGS